VNLVVILLILNLLLGEIFYIYSVYSLVTVLYILKLFLKLKYYI